MRDTLLKARAMVESTRLNFICFALESVGGDFSIPLRDWIHGLLDGQVSLAGWQIKIGLGDRKDEQRRLDRLAWIDWMLDWHGSDETPPCVGLYETTGSGVRCLAHWDGKMWHTWEGGVILDYQTREWRFV